MQINDNSQGMKLRAKEHAFVTLHENIYDFTKKSIGKRCKNNIFRFFVMLKSK